MANNQLPPCSFSTTECLQWWVFAPIRRHTLQGFESEMGVGCLPQGGPLPRTFRYTIMLSLYCRVAIAPQYVIILPGLAK